MEENEKRGRGKPKGLPKSGGRAKGVQNVNYATNKNNVRLFVTQNFKKMEREWEKIKDPYQKVMAFAKIMGFAYPQMKAVEFKAEDAKTTLEAKMLIMMQQTVRKEVEDTEAEEA